MTEPAPSGIPSCNPLRMGSAHHEWRLVEGVKCIIWLKNTSSGEMSNRAKNILKRTKDNLGNHNLDIPILDTCTRNGRVEYCDLILHSQRLQQWQSAIEERFSHCKKITTHPSSGIIKVVFRNENNTEDLIVIHYYTRKNKFMIQPGMVNEKNLLKLIKDLPTVKPLGADEDSNETLAQTTDIYTTSSLSTLTSSHCKQKEYAVEFIQPTAHETEQHIFQTSSSPCKKSNPEENIASIHVPVHETDEHNSQTTISTSSPTCNESEDRSNLTNSAHDMSVQITESCKQTCQDTVAGNTASISMHVPAENMTVILPPLTEKRPHTMQCSLGHTSGVKLQELVTKDINTQTDLETSIDEVYVDELLCFMQNRMLTGLGDLIVKLCSDWFSETEISKSKIRLFQHTEGIRPSRLRHIKRIGDNSKKQNLLDMMNVLRCLPVRSTPMYVAQDLSKLPPLTALDSDVISVHREMEKLKTSMQVFLDMKNDIAVLTNSVNDLRKQNDSVTANTVSSSSTVSATANAVLIASAEEHETSPVTSSRSVTTSTRKELGYYDSIKSAYSSTISATTNDMLTTPVEDHETSDVTTSSRSVTSRNMLNDNMADCNRISVSAHQPIEDDESDNTSLHESITSQQTDTDSSCSEEEDEPNYVVVDSITDSESENTTTEMQETSHIDHLSEERFQWKTVTSRRKKKNPLIIGSGCGNGFKVVNKAGTEPDRSKRKDPVVLGTGCSSGIAVINPVTKERVSSNPNRRITGVFASRFGPRTTAAQIAVHIRRETRLTVRPEKITTKYDNYSSFYIPCDAKKRRIIMDGSVWPEGSLLKPFYN